MYTPSQVEIARFWKLPLYLEPTALDGVGVGARHGIHEVLLVVHRELGVAWGTDKKNWEFEGGNLGNLRQENTRPQNGTSYASPKVVKFFS